MNSRRLIPVARQIGPPEAYLTPTRTDVTRTVPYRNFRQYGPLGKPGPRAPSLSKIFLAKASAAGHKTYSGHSKRGEPMAAQLLARYLAARGIHYGWVIVAITFSFVVCSSAAMSVAGVLVPKISQEFGWSIGEISGPLALRLALFGIMAPFAGALMLRYGLRTVVTGSATLLIAGLVVSILMTAKWQ